MKLAKSAVLCAALLILIPASVPSTYSAPSPSPPPLEEIVTRYKRAVVVINARHVLGHEARGSGFIYDPNGYVLTNQHVVEGAIDITVRLPSGQSFPGVVVDYLRRQVYTGTELQVWIDGAVIKIEGAGLPTIPIGDSDSLRQGQELIVMGYPGRVGTEDVSVIRGIVSAVRQGWIQTDAAMDRGVSGGPVLDRQGRVVALATFVTGALQRIGGAVAINELRPMARDSKDPVASRLQEMKVSGIEYMPGFYVGRRRVTRVSYDPGLTSGQSGTNEYTTEVISVRNHSGAIAYSVRLSDGGEGRNLLDSEGLHTISQTSNSSSTTYPEPALSFPFPPIPGQSWQYRYTFQSSSGIQRAAIVTLRIDSVGELVSVPAGSYQNCLKITSLVQATETSPSPRRVTITETHWWAPATGLVRTVAEVLETRERIVQELVSQN